MEGLNPTAEHTHTIILLHGRNSTAADFKPDFFESESSDGRTLPEIFPGVKWVFPSADPLWSQQHRRYTSQWFDMAKTSRPHLREDEQDMIAGFQRLGKVIEREARIVGETHVFLGGVQQGAAIAIHSLLAQKHRLGGFIGIGSWFPKRERVLEYFLGQRQRCDQIETPALVLHNEDDDEIDLRYGRELHGTLRDIGMRVKYHSYETGGNWLNEPEGVDALIRWLAKRMGRRSISEHPQGALASSEEAGDFFAAGSQREVALLARRIHENMTEERKRELLAANRNHRKDDPAARTSRCDPVEMYCMSRAQRQLSSSRCASVSEKMKLMSAS